MVYILLYYWSAPVSLVIRTFDRTYAVHTFLRFGVQSLSNATRDATMTNPKPERFLSLRYIRTHLRSIPDDSL